MKNKEIKKIFKGTVRKSSPNATQKLLVIFVVILFLFATGGLVYIAGLKMRFDKEKNLLSKELIKTQEEKLKAGKDTNICKSDISGWRKDFFITESATTTENWSDYKKLSTYEKIPFSIEYPEYWIKKGNDLYEERNGISIVRVASIGTGLIMLEPNQKCFDNQSLRKHTADDNNPGPHLFSEEELIIDGREGALRITENKSTLDENYTYTSVYCISDKNRAFRMSFYEKELDFEKRDLFEKIISTVKFN